MQRAVRSMILETAMLIVVEGPDRAGKTTVLDALVTRWRMRHPWRDVRRFVHPPRLSLDGRPYPHEHTTYMQYLMLKEFVDLDSVDIFFDRFWVTDEIYNRVCRRGMFDYTYCQNPIVDFRRFCLVYVTVPLAMQLARRQAETGDVDPDEERLASAIHDAYERYFAETRLPTIHVDGVLLDKFLASVVDTLVEQLETIERLQ